MLQAYVDGSGTGSDDFLVVAGYIATPESWAEFSREWERLIDMQSPHYRRLSYFKMKEMTSDADRERCSWFYRVIEKHVMAGVSCVIDVAGLRKAVREFAWPPWIYNVEILENPYYSAFKAITDMLAQHQHKIGLTEPVDFIFDNESEKELCISAWEDLKRNSRSEVLALMGDTPIYRDDKTVLPLQAADLYAYWVRNWQLSGDEDGLAQLKFPWKTERDIPRIDFKFGEKDFIVEFNRIWKSDVQRRMGINSSGLSTALGNAMWSASGWTGKMP